MNKATNNTEVTIKVSGINEVQVLNLMKNVASITMELELNYGELDASDRRHEEVTKARESLLNTMRALATLHAYEVETNAQIQADTIRDTERKK